MRVLYVAMTRAKDRLIMTYAAGNLENELTDLAMRMDMCKPQLLTSEADCPGKWILMTALGRTEAGEFFALCGYPEKTRFIDPPWLIRLAEGDTNQQSAAAASAAAEELDPQILQRLKEGLAFQYAHTQATQAPSKQTATQLKGRVKDQEAAEYTQEQKQIVRSWRRPSFAGEQVDGKSYGKAIHAVMQYIRYEACESAAGVAQEVARLVEQGYISQEYGTIVDCSKIAAFFESDLGKKVRTGNQVLREFKFSILDDGSRYVEGLQNEKVLLQGVVDCALIESDGITVIDFKTDYVTDETLPAVVERYRPQITAYADALERIYHMPVKAKQIYFFTIRCFAELN